jgi:hypothetical protein
MSDIFFFKRKDGSKVERIFVDYWFGVFPGEVADTREELFEILKTQEIPVKGDGENPSVYQVLLGGDSRSSAEEKMEKLENRWNLFKDNNIFKDGYTGRHQLGGNIIVDVLLENGNASTTLFTSHTDTVHRTDGFQNISFESDESTGQYIITSLNDECLGGDDGTGVFLMTKLIEAGIPGRYIFHRAEEVGGLGSGYIEKSHQDLLAGYTKAMAFDRKGKNSVITYQSCSRCCSDMFAEDLGNHLMNSSKKYYLELFQAGDSLVMCHARQPVPEERTGWRNIKGARPEQTVNQYNVKQFKVPQEQYTYSVTPKNNFWDEIELFFNPDATEMSEEDIHTALINHANEEPDEMNQILISFLAYVDEDWETDTGGSFTDTANYTENISECTNLSVGYYNAHTQSEYQDYAFLYVFLKGLIETPWEELYVADPFDRGYQNIGYTGYRNTYIAPSKTILANATKEEIEEVNRRKAEQKTQRALERDEKRAMQDMFGLDDDWNEDYGPDEDYSLDSWHEGVESISSFWDDRYTVESNPLREFYGTELE